MVLIGFGGMGSKYAKILADGRIEGMVLQGICCRNQKGQQQIREWYPQAAIYRDVEDTFAHADDFDAVLIVTPHMTHAEIGKLAFSCGKHVFCDKPIGVSVKEADAFLTVKREDTAFAMMFHNRVQPAFQKAKEMLVRGELGRVTRVLWTCNNWFRSPVYHASAPWRSSWNGECGGLLINQCQHFLDIWQWLFGMPDVIDADLDFGKYNDFSVDDGADIRFRYKDEAGVNAMGQKRLFPGLRGSLISASGEHPGVNRLEIWGTGGCLRIDDGKVLTLDRNLVDIDTFNRENEAIYGQPEHRKEVLTDGLEVPLYERMLQNFSDHLHKGTALAATGEDGRNAIMLTNAAYLSAWTGEKLALPIDGDVYEAELEKRKELERSGERLAHVDSQAKDADLQRKVANMVPESDCRLETASDIDEILEGAKTGIWIIELEEGCEPRMYGNTTMLNLLGIEADISPEECYKGWYERIEPECLEMVQEAVQDMLQNGRSETMYPWYHPTKGKVYVRCGGVADRNFDKPGFCMKGYHQDITDITVTRQKQDKAIRDAMIEARRANQAKSEFLSYMSHDIRTPINGILGMVAICEKNQGNEEKQKECREKIRLSAEHLLALINDVLDISKLESGAFSMAVEPFDLHDVMDNCMVILRPQVDQQGLDMDVKLVHVEHARLIGSPLNLRQILINIIGNAIKYNRPKGSIWVTLEELSADETHAAFRFTVEDTGIGISEQFQKYIFEPFTQEANDARTSFKGAGLGMSITKKLVDQMGGEIELESEPGKGSIFRVTLPFEIDQEPEQHVEEKQEEITADVSGMKVLLVEDNEINCEIVQYMLEDAGAVVTIAENGRIAVETFTASEPGFFDCILMDVMMPVMNGLDAARAIRGMERSDAMTVPILALSANAFDEDAKKTQEAGMNAHLTKPIDVDELLRVMTRQRKLRNR